MFILGIECTAHTYGVGVVDSDKWEVIFNERNQFAEVEGMDLRKLSEFHTANFDSVLVKVKVFLAKKGFGFEDLGLISFSRGPGIGNALKIGACSAKSLALKYNLPIIGVNHIRAHLEIAKLLTGFEDPLFLFVSGVNTQVIAKDLSGKYKIYGETEDIGLGNLLDSFARLVGLDFPGGPKIERLAKKSNNFIELPFILKGMNVSLAGIFSNLKQKIDKFERGEKIPITKERKVKYYLKEDLISDLSFSLQETCFATVMEICERAMAYTKKREFVIVGGVGSNKRLNEMALEICKIYGSNFKSFPMEFAMDNGAMIAWLGYLERKNAKKSIKNLKPLPYVNIESEF